MQITDELLKSIFTRADEFCRVKFSKVPDHYIYDSDLFQAVFVEYNCGDRDTDYEPISANDLTSDLEIVAQERIERERLATLDRERQFKIEQEKRKIREKELRRQKFLELKEEFGD